MKYEIAEIEKMLEEADKSHVKARDYMKAFFRLHEAAPEIILSLLADLKTAEQRVAWEIVGLANNERAEPHGPGAGTYNLAISDVVDAIKAKYGPFDE